MVLRKNLYIILIVLLMIVSGGAFLFLSDKECRASQEVLYVLINIVVFLAAKNKSKRNANLVSLFLFSTLFFGGECLPLDLVGYEDITNLYYFTQTKIAEAHNNRAMMNLNLSLCAVGLGYILYRGRDKIASVQLLEKKKSFTIHNILLWFFLIIGFTAKLYIAYKAVSLIMSGAYLDYFTEGIQVSRYIRALAILPAFVCFYKIIRERSVIWFWVLVLYAFLSMATGQRGPAMLMILVGVYYSVRYGIIRISLTKVGIMFAIAVPMLILMQQLRAQQDNELDQDIVTDFFWGNLTSFSVLQIAVEDYDKLDYHVSDFFGNIRFRLSGFLTGGSFGEAGKDSQTIQAVKYKMWSGYISYHVNSGSYYSGGGMGGNYVGQAYAAGKEPVVLIVAFLVGLFLCWLDRNIITNKVIKGFIIFMIIQSVIYIPRDNLMDFVTDLIEPLIMLMFVYIMYVPFCILIAKRNQYAVS